MLIERNDKDEKGSQSVGIICMEMLQPALSHYWQKHNTGQAAEKRLFSYTKPRQEKKNKNKIICEALCNKG